MMKNTVILVLILLHGTLGFSQQLSRADYLEDLQYLKDTLPKRHINLFAKMRKVDFDKTITAIQSRLTTPDDEIFITELFKLTVAIGDEHTHIEPVFTKVIPIRFDKFTEGIYVTATDTNNTDILQYQLTGINGHTITEVTSLFKEIIQSKNPSFFDAGLLHFISNPVILKGLQITHSTNETTFDLTSPDGKTIKRGIRSVAGTNADNLPLVVVKNRPLSQQREKYYWYAYNSGSGTLYFNYNNCKEQDAHPFSAFNEELFTVIDKQKPQHLVVDLRYNSGGNSAILSPFIEHIRQSYLNSKGKLIVLIGKQTFSSAIMNAIELKRGTNATLVGEPTSGSVNHYGEVRGFRLPHTKIIIGYSTRYWENWKGHDGPLKPDVSITYSVKNYLHGIDEAMVYADKAQ